MITRLMTNDPLAYGISGAAIGTPIWFSYLPVVGQGIMFALGVAFLALKVYNAWLDGKLKKKTLDE